MKKIFKNTIHIFMLIAGLVIFSHSLIPHDHHYNLSNDLADEHRNNEPIHCHLFNNIDIVDNIAHRNSISVLRELPALFINTFSVFFNTDINYQANNLIKTNDNRPDYWVLISISPTRGSPLI